MAEAGDKVCRTESLRSANEYAVRRRGTRYWRGGVACVLAGVQWRGGSHGSAIAQAQMSVPGASTGLMRCRLQVALRNSTRNSHNARAC